MTPIPRLHLISTFTRNLILYTLLERRHLGFIASSQNKDTQKVDASNRCHAMIHHQNAGISPPWTSAILNYQGGECLSNAHWLGPWRQHFEDELRLPQNRWKIIGKSGFCMTYSVASFWLTELPSIFITIVQPPPEQLETDVI